MRGIPKKLVGIAVSIRVMPSCESVEPLPVTRSRVGRQPGRAKRGLTGRAPGMVFWGDLYDDFLDRSGLRSGHGAGGVVRFLVCGRRWVCTGVGTSRLVRWRGSQCGKQVVRADLARSVVSYTKACERNIFSMNRTGSSVLSVVVRRV